MDLRPITEPGAVLTVSRDVRARRLDAGWLIHFRADAPVNVGFEVSDKAFQEVVRYSAGAEVPHDPVKSEFAAQFASTGILVATAFEIDGASSEVSLDEIAALREGVPVEDLGMLELESVVLYLLARDNPRSEPVCELGSMLGGSTIALALGTRRSQHAPRVIAIDDHEWHQHLANAARPEAVATLPSTLPRFQANLKRAGVDAIVEVVIGDTAASGRSYDGELSMLFVDADHSLRAVREDLAAWLPKVAPGGVLGFHDYGNPLWPDVRRAVDERQGDLSGLSVLQTLAVARPATR